MFGEIKKVCKSSILALLASVVLIACIICIIILVICTALEGDGSDCSRCLCPAQTIAETDAPGDFISFDIPPNAGITKIYASLVQNPDNPIEGVEIFILSPTSPTGIAYAHWFSKDPLARVGSFETTLVQPLCIGEEGATLLYSTLGQVDATILHITVVYCPDYCMQ